MGEERIVFNSDDKRVELEDTCEDGRCQEEPIEVWLWVDSRSTDFEFMGICSDHIDYYANRDDCEKVGDFGDKKLNIFGV